MTHRRLEHPRRQALPWLRGALDGPPFALPEPLDRWSERWWSLRPRTRLLATGVVVGALVAITIARAAASPYGAPVTVLVADRDLTVGHVVTAADLRPYSWPSNLVPHDALHIDDRAFAVGRTVTASLIVGTVATRRHLGDLGIVEALPDGKAGVPVPLAALPDLQVGSRITVVAHELDGRAVELTSDALVVGQDAGRVWLAVDPIHGPRIAGAAAAGRLTAVVHGR